MQRVFDIIVTLHLIGSCIFVVRVYYEVFKNFFKKIGGRKI